MYYSGQPRLGSTLETLVRSVSRLREVRKGTLQTGDWLFMKTVRSVYRICVLGRNQYEVSGGWFDKKGLSPEILTIVGCTWGGSTIKVDIVAACGLRLEFGNRLITSPIQKIFVLPRGSEN